jgi:hypothetical protein
VNAHLLGRLPQHQPNEQEIEEETDRWHQHGIPIIYRSHGKHCILWVEGFPIFLAKTSKSFFLIVSLLVASLHTFCLKEIMASDLIVSG